MSCPACTRAAHHPRTGIFQSGCKPCAARALAQSPEFHEAAREGGDKAAYRAALVRLLPEMAVGEAHAMVKEWAERLRARRAEA